MVLRFPAPSSLNFLAGLFAGAGINMLTSLSNGTPDGISPQKIAIDSALWVIAAAFLTWSAQLLECAGHHADRLSGNRMNKVEIEEIRQATLRPVLARTLFALGMTALSVALAVLLLPGLIHFG